MPFIHRIGLETYVMHFVIVPPFSRQFVVKRAGATGFQNRYPSILGKLHIELLEGGGTLRLNSP